MPDLRTEVVSDWLDAVRPVYLADAWPPAVRPIEASPTAAALLVELGQLLDQLAETHTEALSSLTSDPTFLDDIQEVFAQVGAARALAFFHWLREAGLPNHLAIENALLDRRSSSGRALFATVTTVARQATLQRLISTERMEELALAMDAANQEPSHA